MYELYFHSFILVINISLQMFEQQAIPLLKILQICMESKEAACSDGTSQVFWTNRGASITSQRSSSRRADWALMRQVAPRLQERPQFNRESKY